MWCTEVAVGALLTFWDLVSGDIGDHGRSALGIETCTLRTLTSLSVTWPER
jgi:hypothetical protein